MCSHILSSTFPPKLYTAAESAAILGVSLRTLHKWLDAGLIPHTRLGPAARLIRIRAEDIDQFLRDGMPTPPEQKQDVPPVEPCHEQANI